MTGFTLVAACCASLAMSAPTRLTEDNARDVGDAIVELFDTRMLDLANLVMVPSSKASSMRRVSVIAPRSRSQSLPFQANCPAGGSVTGAIMDADSDETLSTGDRVSVDFHRCRVSPADEVVTGGSEFEVARHAPDEVAEVVEFHYQFDDFGTESLRWNGTALVTVREGLRTGGDHVAVDYLDLEVERWAQACRWNFRLDVWRSPLGLRAASLGGELMLGDLQLRLDQQEPFVFERNAARTGRLTVMDAEGNLVQIEGSKQGYRYSWRGTNGSELSLTGR